MQSTRSARTQEREAYFLSFAKAVRAQYPDVLLMVTGGFRTRRGMATAIREGDCDLIGIARPAVLNPSLPKNKIFNSEIEDTEVLYTKAFEKPWLEKITGNKIAGSGAESVRSLYTLLEFGDADMFDRNGTVNRFGKTASSCSRVNSI